MADHEGRREFITLLGGAAAWPLVARAQQSERVRRIGILLPASADDAEYQARLARSCKRLRQLGWTESRNVRIDTRGPDDDTDGFADMRRNWPRSRRTSLWPPTRPGRLLRGHPHRADRIPDIGDPVAGGHVESLARPGGNATGFSSSNQFEREMAGAAQGGRAGGDAGGSPSRYCRGQRHQPVCRHPGRGAVTQDGINPVNWATPAASSEPLRTSRAPEWWSDRGGGGSAQRHRDLIVTLAARHKLPAVYSADP